MAKNLKGRSNKNVSPRDSTRPHVVTNCYVVSPSAENPVILTIRDFGKISDCQREPAASGCDEVLIGNEKSLPVLNLYFQIFSCWLLPLHDALAFHSLIGLSKAWPAYVNRGIGTEVQIICL